MIFSPRESNMQTTGIAGQLFLSSLYILKAANEQPKLAAELISKTIEDLQKQNTQTPAAPVDIPDTTGKGKIINVTA
jgi:hypothetical protein